MTSHIPSLTLPAFCFEHPAVSILLPVIAGGAVGYSTQPQRVFKTYDTAIKQPPYAPPPYVFGPAWSILYVIMGYAAHRAWSKAGASFDVNQAALAKHGATLYTIQLGLNLVWMPLFFVAKRPIEATFDIAALTGTVGYLAYIWHQIDPVCGWLLTPYIGWLTYATYLCAGIGYLNGWDLVKASETKEKK